MEEIVDYFLEYMLNLVILDKMQNISIRNLRAGLLKVFKWNWLKHSSKIL